MGDKATIKSAEASASTALASSRWVPPSLGAAARFALFPVVSHALRRGGVGGGLDRTIPPAPLVVVVVAARRDVMRKAGSLGPSTLARPTRLA
jgi:hypothetical protein